MMQLKSPRCPRFHDDPPVLKSSGEAETQRLCATLVGCMPLVRAIVRRAHGLSIHDREDAVQQALCNALVAINDEGFRGDPSMDIDKAMSRWVYFIARNTAWRLAKIAARARGLLVVDIEGMVDFNSDPSMAVEAGDLEDRQVEILKALVPESCHAILKGLVRGGTITEIAKLLGESRGTVSCRWSRTGVTSLQWAVA